MLPRFLFAAVLFLTCGSLAFAQKPGGGGNTGGGGGSTGSPPTIGNVPNIPSQSAGADVQVRISWPNEQRLQQSVHVQLLNATGVPIMDTFSSPDGNVTFHAVPAGSYKLKLDGAEIKDSTTDTFQVGYMEHMHMEWVHVSQKENAQQQSMAGAAPMISASELNVPSKAQSEMEKGMDAFGKGDMKKASEKLQKAIDIYPKYARAWNNLGVVRMRDNDKEGARDAWQKGIEADSRFAPCYMNLARLNMMDNKMPDALAFITKGLSFDPNNVEGLSLLAKEQLLTKQYDKALVSARKVHGLPHDHLADVHLIAGEALWHEGHDSEAVQEYELYLKEYPDSPKAAVVRAAMAQIQAKQTRPN